MSEPVVIPGMILQLSGHPARVVKITHDGVLVQVGNNRPITIPFNQVETALKKK